MTKFRSIKAIWKALKYTFQSDEAYYAKGEKTVKNKTAEIVETKKGFILSSCGVSLGGYTRRRDAVRGAERRGLTVVAAD